MKNPVKKSRWKYPLAVLVATLFAAPSANAYELKTSRGGDTIRWEQETIELRLSDEYLHRFGPQKGRQAAEMAAQGWNDAGLAPEIVITDEDPGRPGDEPTNGIYVMDPWINDGDQLAVTRTVSTEGGIIVGVDIFLNGSKAMHLLEEAENPHFYDLGAVLSHEMGHVLGLDESADHPEAAMYPAIGPGELHQRTPQDDDRAGIAAIYDGEEMAVGCTVCAIPAPASRWGAALIFIVLLGTWGRRRGGTPAGSAGGIVHQEGGHFVLRTEERASK